MSHTLLDARQLSKRIHYSSVYINRVLKDSVFHEGIHYIRPFSGRKILYIWEAVETELYKAGVRGCYAIPMSRGGVSYG
ncbi:MAG: hypothetical protein KKB00_09945 [Gammaproteobacteria bacterium]|jgi:hypothetical protein|nr:hypothetical protein [Gammaproteobacteria bacterium]